MLRGDQLAVKKDISGVRALFPSCREVSRIQSDGARRSLAQRFGMKLHLLVCSWCRRYGRQVRFLQRFAHDEHEPAVEPSPLSSEAKERLKKSLGQNSGADVP